MAEAGAWENIRQYGLLSTEALLNLFEIGEPRRTRINAQYRRKDCDIRHPEYGCAIIRRQTRMPPDKLQTALTDNMNSSEWYRLLNGKVFFWPTQSRLNGFLEATAHMGRCHDVLTVCTRSLAEQYVNEQRTNEINLSPINSGTVFRPDHRRGRNTFQRITDYGCTDRLYKGERECFAELAVAGSVLNINQHVLSVDRWVGANCAENIWQK